MFDSFDLYEIEGELYDEMLEEIYYLEELRTKTKVKDPIKMQIVVVPTHKLSYICIVSCYTNRGCCYESS